MYGGKWSSLQSHTERSTALRSLGLHLFILPSLSRSPRNHSSFPYFHSFVFSRISCSWVQTECSPLDVFFLFPFPQIFMSPPSSQNTRAIPLKQNREVKNNEKKSSPTWLTQSLNMTGHLGGGVIVQSSLSSYQEDTLRRRVRPFLPPRSIPFLFS